MEETTIFTKVLQNGTSAEIRIGSYCDEPVVLLYIEGRQKNCWRLSIPLDLPKPVLAANGITYRHALGVLALTAEEAATVSAAMDAEKTAYDVTPQAIARKLRRQRQRLYEVHEGTIIDMNAHRDGRYHHDTGMHGMAAHEAAVAASGKAIEAFDADHPEVIAEIQAESAERIARFLAIN